jgi:hypothetical protein
LGSLGGLCGSVYDDVGCKRCLEVASYDTLVRVRQSEKYFAGQNTVRQLTQFEPHGVS